MIQQPENQIPEQTALVRFCEGQGTGGFRRTESLGDIDANTDLVYSGCLHVELEVVLC